MLSTTTNIFRVFFLLLLLWSKEILPSAAELTEEIILAKEVAWARRAMIRLHHHHLSLDNIKYEVPLNDQHNFPNEELSLVNGVATKSHLRAQPTKQ
jgi:hypothetical protein